jgi:hypothetical protein
MKILVIPGLGDIHWVMLKMESFIANHCNGETPEIWIWNFDNRPRSHDFIARIPFVKFGGYWDRGIDVAPKIFKQAYKTGEVTVLRDFQGFDYFICFNGRISNGVAHDKIEPSLQTNWDYPIDLSGLPRPRAGKYVLAFFSDFGMFTNWINRANPENIRLFLKSIPYEIILTGSSWDEKLNSEFGEFENLCGKTSFNEFLALMLHSEAMVGWCGGNTMLASHLKIPTLMGWCKSYFPNPGFRTNWANPVTIGTTYQHFEVEDWNRGHLLNLLEKAIEQKSNVA